MISITHLLKRFAQDSNNYDKPQSHLLNLDLMQIEFISLKMHFYLIKQNEKRLLFFGKSSLIFQNRVQMESLNLINFTHFSNFFPTLIKIIVLSSA